MTTTYQRCWACKGGVRAPSVVRPASGRVERWWHCSSPHCGAAHCEVTGGEVAAMTETTLGPGRIGQQIRNTLPGSFEAIVVDAVLETLGVDRHLWDSWGRTLPCVSARELICYILRVCGRHSGPDVAPIVGLRSHTSVFAASKRLAAAIDDGGRIVAARGMVHADCALVIAQRRVRATEKGQMWIPEEPQGDPCPGCAAIIGSGRINPTAAPDAAACEPGDESGADRRPVEREEAGKKE